MWNRECNFLRERLQLRPLTGGAQDIDRTFCCFAMDLQLKTIFEEHLHHRPHHHFHALIAFGLGVDLIARSEARTDLL